MASPTKLLGERFWIISCSVERHKLCFWPPKLNALSVMKYCTEKQENRVESSEEVEEIEKLRNVSRMPPHFRRLLRGEPQTFEEYRQFKLDIVTSTKEEKLARRFYGLFGKASGVNPGKLWPTKKEIEEIKEREKEFFPTLQEMMANVKKQDEEIAEKQRLRVEEVKEKLAKLDYWMNDLEKRKQKKMDEIQAQKEKKERLIEEVRAHFGYRVDPKDEKFQDLLQQKEKEERKALKEAKKKEKIAKELARINALAEKSKKEVEEREAKKLEEKEAQRLEEKLKNSEGS